MELHPPYYIVSFVCDQVADAKPLASFAEIIGSNPPGLLGVETVQGQTFSYWSDLESIRFWNMQEHSLSQVDEARRNFYQTYRLDITKCELTLQ